MCLLSRGKEIQKSEKFKKENPKEKIQRATLYVKRGFTTKEKVSSNLSASLVNYKRTITRYSHSTSSFGNKPLVTLN